jgi:hypothetical protein
MNITDVVEEVADQIEEMMGYVPNKDRVALEKAIKAAIKTVYSTRKV